MTTAPRLAFGGELRLWSPRLLSSSAWRHLHAQCLSQRVRRVSSQMMLSEGLTVRGESGTVYRLVDPLGRRRNAATPNVWTVVENSDGRPEFVAKVPSDEDNESMNWPVFQHEVKMQRLFAEDPMIRPMVDYVPNTEVTKPMMILKPFQKTLWDARATRPFTTQEIKWIMKGVLLGIMTVHRRGLVYTDLKMENVAVSGFDNDKPNENLREIIVRLADLGATSKAGSREISALTYRRPEVHFGKPWDENTDVWAWGIILAQLLLAQVDFKSPGMYDSIAVGTLDEKTKAARDAMAVDFDLHSLPFYIEDAECRALLPPPQPEKAHMWAEAMMAKGVSGEDIQFLANTLNPLPHARFSTAEILESGYLET